MNIKIIVSTILSFSIFLGVTAVAGSEVLVSDTKVFQHKVSSGGKGLDSINLRAPRVPKNSCAVFKNAVVKYTKRQYGKVEITKRPKAQCNPKKEQCKLGVSWEHTPSGRLDYKVKVSWQLTPC